MPKVENFCKQ